MYFAASPGESTRTFSITYAGQLYEGKRDPSLLLSRAGWSSCESRSFHRAKCGHASMGRSNLGSLPRNLRYGLEGVVESNGVIGPDGSSAARDGVSDAAPAGWNYLKGPGTFVGELLSILAPGRPILALGGSPGVLTEALEESKTGVTYNPRKIGVVRAGTGRCTVSSEVMDRSGTMLIQAR